MRIMEAVNMRILFVCLILMLVAASSALADSIPNNVSVTFQQFNSSTGVPLNGTHIVTVRFYEAAAGLSPVINETSRVTFLNGVSNLDVGNTSGYAWSSACWFTMQVAGGTESSRIPCRAAPQARWAVNAENAAHATVASSLNGSITVSQISDLQNTATNDSLLVNNVTQLRQNLSALPNTATNDSTLAYNISLAWFNFTYYLNNLTQHWGNFSALPNTATNDSALENNVSQVRGNLTSLPNTAVNVSLLINNVTQVRQNLSALPNTATNDSELAYNISLAWFNFTYYANNITQHWGNITANNDSITAEISRIYDNITQAMSNISAITDFPNTATNDSALANNVSQVRGNLTALPNSATNDTDFFLNFSLNWFNWTAQFTFNDNISQVNISAVAYTDLQNTTQEARIAEAVNNLSQSNTSAIAVAKIYADTQITNNISAYQNQFEQAVTDFGTDLGNFTAPTNESSVNITGAGRNITVEASGNAFQVMLKSVVTGIQRLYALRLEADTASATLINGTNFNSTNNINTTYMYARNISVDVLILNGTPIYSNTSWVCEGVPC